MKKTLLFCLLFVSTFIYAQKKYAVFGIDNKFGVVNILTGDEFIKPEFVQNKIFFRDFISFVTNDELILFNKIDGEKSIYKKTQDDSFYLRDLVSKMGESSLRLHIIEDNKSKVVNSENEKIVLPKQYLKLESTKELLFGINDDNTIDVFKYKNLNEIILTIKASNFINERIYKAGSEDYKRYYVFYTDNGIFVYNDNFELAKSYDKSGKNNNEILNILKEDFVTSEVITQGMYWEDWYLKYSNEYTIFEFEGMPYFKLKGDFDLITNDWRFIEIKDKKTNKKYFFYFDVENRRISLPKKVQNEFDLQFLN
ncbi:hypothetical protein [Flavobacterium sp. I3-2]|uniref:hypothetical protein n=1 Tax=Flavobacterium sp. I3-2 TaxID=2748319 RepID=UPI0015B00E69|nr:hypothetical protein [Flavobacterium sp. I3-2]